MENQPKIIKIQKPKIPGCIEKIEINIDADNEEGYTDSLIEGYDLADFRRDYLSFDSCIIRNSSLNGSISGKALITDTKFEDCDLSNIKLSQSGLHRVEFINCRLTGADFSGSTLKDTSFINCKYDYIGLSYSKVKSIKFDVCNLEHGEMINSEISNALFNKCDLNSFEFFGTSLRGIDFSTCNIEGIKVGIDDIRGMVIDRFQAAQIAALFDIRII